MPTKRDAQTHVTETKLPAPQNEEKEKFNPCMDKQATAKSTWS